MAYPVAHIIGDPKSECYCCVGQSFAYFTSVQYIHTRDTGFYHFENNTIFAFSKSMQDDPDFTAFSAICTLVTESCDGGPLSDWSVCSISPLILSF